jgi:uncharacterized protein YvpB
VTPKTYGEIIYNDTLIGKHLVRTFVFRPEVTWLPDTTYEIRVTNVKSALPTYRAPQEFVYTFTTEATPSITAVLPEHDTTIRPDTAWRVVLDKPNESLSEYEFRLAPDIEVTAELDQTKKEYTITPKTSLSQGGKYSLEIFRRDVRYLFGTDTVAKQEEAQSVWQGSWPVREAPGIASFSPAGQTVPLATNLEVVFSENVDFDSFKEQVTIEPVIAGEWQTTDYKTITFKPAALTKETTYTVTLKAGLQTYAGGFLTEDAVHSFTTIGLVKLSGSTPADKAQGISVAGSVRMNFNQTVDHASAQSAFSINPQTAGTLSWEGETMVFKPDNPLAYNTIYTVTLASGIKSQGGYDSTEVQAISFTTELSVTRLSVPFHRQEHNLSCEVATLVMALQYRGVNVSEATLISAIGFDPTPKANGVWGNPYQAFVGDIDGHQSSTGYGVYWDPVATAAKQYRPARVISGGKLSDITAEIKKGNPVIFWGTAGTGRRIDWKTPSGQSIMAVSGEHTRVAIGFIGSADNPTKIITLDPLFGEKYFSQSSFMANWAVLGYRGVVVE